MEGKTDGEEHYSPVKFSEGLKKPYFSKLEIQLVKTEWLKCEPKSYNWTIIAYEAAA